MNTLWDKHQERNFFLKCLEIVSTKQLFYVTHDKKYLAYWPKKYEGAKTTLQSRNALIGSYTEKWVGDLLGEIAESVNGYPMQGVISEEIGLTKQSPADVAICKTKEIIQKPNDILLIVEVKMSVVWNWEFIPETKELRCVGDYLTHQGNPSLLRSDSMLKAIGKSINIRVSSFRASKIPIVVIGNTPVAKSYWEKVDNLKRNGIIQGFWSVNPKPLDDEDTPKFTPHRGFLRIDSYQELKENILALLNEEREFFAGMHTRKRVGEIIELANREKDYLAKTHKFLELLRNSEEGNG